MPKRFRQNRRSEHIRLERLELTERLEAKGYTPEEARQYLRDNPITDRMGGLISDQSWFCPAAGRTLHP